MAAEDRSRLQRHSLHALSKQRKHHMSKSLAYSSQRHSHTDDFPTAPTLQVIRANTNFQSIISIQK